VNHELVTALKLRRNSARPGCGTRRHPPHSASDRCGLTRINRWRYAPPPTYPSRRVPVRLSEANRTMSERAAKHVRKFLGQRLRTLRKQDKICHDYARLRSTSGGVGGS
jgi:hypothetical protein